MNEVKDLYVWQHSKRFPVKPGMTQLGGFLERFFTALRLFRMTIHPCHSRRRSGIFL